MKEEKISNDQILKCIDDIYIILLDGINVGELEWVFESHSYIERTGFFTIIDISDLQKGRHNLIIYSNSKYSLKDQFDTDLKPVLMDKMLCTQCGSQIISKVTIHHEGKQDLFFCSDSCASTHTNNIPGSQNGMKISLSEEVSRHSNNLFEVRSTETAIPSGGSRIE